MTPDEQQLSFWRETVAKLGHQIDEHREAIPNARDFSDGAGGVDWESYDLAVTEHARELQGLVEARKSASRTRHTIWTAIQQAKEAARPPLQFSCHHCGHYARLKEAPENCPACGKRIAPVRREVSPEERTRNARLYDELVGGFFGD